MPMVASPALEHELIAWLASRWTMLLLHTGDPGSLGANELRGGLYRRHRIVWTPDGYNVELIEVVCPQAKITHLGLANDAGNFECANNTQEKTVRDGGIYQIPPHALSIAGFWKG